MGLWDVLGNMELGPLCSFAGPGDFSKLRTSRYMGVSEDSLLFREQLEVQEPSRQTLALSSGWCRWWDGGSLSLSLQLPHSHCGETLFSSLVQPHSLWEDSLHVRFFFPGARCLNKKLQNQCSYSQRERFVWFLLFFFFFSFPFLSCPV